MVKLQYESSSESESEVESIKTTGKKKTNFDDLDKKVKNKIKKEPKQEIFVKEVEPIEQEQPKETPKIKKERTEKQIETTRKMREALQKKREEAMKQKQDKDIELKDIQTKIKTKLKIKKKVESRRRC